MRLLPVFSCFILSLLRVNAGEVVTLPEIGAHLPILTVEKNVNPQNIMVIYTKVDAAGRFLPDPDDPGRPMFDFYWLMDGRNYKPVNSMIKAEIRKRFEARWPSSGRASHFVVNLNDLKEVKSDLKDLTMDVFSSGAGGSARNAEAQMNLGPSNGNARIRLSSIYTEGRAFPPAVQSVTLRGEEIVSGVPTGKKVNRKFVAEGEAN